MMAMPGARLSTVMGVINWIVRVVIDPPSPSEIECPALRHRPPAGSAGSRARVPLSCEPVLQVGDLGQAHGELTGLFALHLFELAARDETLADIEFDRVIDTPVEGKDRILAQPKQVADQWAGLSDRDRDLYRDRGKRVGQIRGRLCRLGVCCVGHAIAFLFSSKKPATAWSIA